MSKMKVSVKAKSETSMRTEVTARNFKMIIDEPENMGGSNRGANPVEYFLASLTGCLNVVGHLIAGEMGFKLNSLEIDVEGELDPAKFSGQPTESRTGFSDIRVTIKPAAEADKETLEKWLKAVEGRCPVSDNITNTTPVRIALG